MLSITLTSGEPGGRGQKCRQLTCRLRSVGRVQGVAYLRRLPLLAPSFSARVARGEAESSAKVLRGFPPLPFLPLRWGGWVARITLPSPLSQLSAFDRSSDAKSGKSPTPSPADAAEHLWVLHEELVSFVPVQILPEADHLRELKDPLRPAKPRYPFSSILCQTVGSDSCRRLRLRIWVVLQATDRSRFSAPLTLAACTTRELFR